MNKEIRNIKVLAIIILIITVEILVYKVTGFQSTSTKHALVVRGIDTSSKMWLNGYLGVFFNFKYLGNINWLLLLFLPYLIKTYQNRPNWQKAIQIFILSSFAIISIYGFFNERYQLTIFPLVLAVLLYIIFERFSKEKNLLILILIGLSLLICTNFVKYFMADFMAKHESKISKMIDLKNQNKNTAGLKNESIIDEINKLNITKSNQVLVNNLPFYYYYTDLPGVYYSSIEDCYYTETGKSKLASLNSKEAITKALVDTLNCNYILSSLDMNLYNETFSNYLETNCDKIIEVNKVVLYKVIQKGYR